MRKVVYSPCYGGFGLSDLAKQKLAERKGVTVDELPYERRLERHDPDLVAVVEELGAAASDKFADLQVTQVEGSYRIQEYDGFEHVETPSQIEWK